MTVPAWCVDRVAIDQRRTESQSINGEGRHARAMGDTLPAVASRADLILIEHAARSTAGAVRWRGLSAPRYPCRRRRSSLARGKCNGPAWRRRRRHDASAPSAAGDGGDARTGRCAGRARPPASPRGGHRLGSARRANDMRKTGTYVRQSTGRLGWNRGRALCRPGLSARTMHDEHAGHAYTADGSQLPRRSQETAAKQRLLCPSARRGARPGRRSRSAGARRSRRRAPRRRGVAPRG